MPFNGSGVFQRVRNWVADAAAGIKIRADYHDAEDDGFAEGLTNCIAKDGQTLITQNIPFNNKRITGLADPINAQDAVTKASLPALVSDVSLPLTGGTITGDFAVTGNSTVTGNLTVTGTTIVGALTATGKIITANSIGDLNNGAGSAALEIRGAAAADDAYLTFHRQGSYAVNFGLHGSDLYVGGWSMGEGVRYKVITTKDLNPVQLFAGLPVTIVGAEGYWTSTVDEQKMLVAYPNAITVTINGAAHPVGTAITFYCHAASMGINNSEYMAWRNASGVATSGNRGLGQFGTATAVKWTAGNWMISGNGLT